jgi:predicted esterase
VRFCPTETLSQRVASFDGVPLDVDVTLPASGTGPFPTIVMLHGWGGSKTSFESRLWDILPSGEERLISRGVHRLTENQTGTITFPLHGNGY